MAKSYYERKINPLPNQQTFGKSCNKRLNQP